MQFCFLVTIFFLAMHTTISNDQDVGLHALCRKNRCNLGNQTNDDLRRSKRRNRQRARKNKQKSNRKHKGSRRKHK